MARFFLPVLAALFLAPACGDNLPGEADASVGPEGPLLDRLEALSGVVTVTELGTDYEGYRRFDLRFEQLVDHDDPDGQTFVQQMTLFHVDVDAPMILLSTGYWNYYGDYLGELATLLHANQLVVEHRYFASSRPDPADWTKLTIEQAAGDHHVITQQLATIYDAAWLATGASKGGMTSMYHRRFWPDDVAGTVPYVAPISFGAPDYAYDTFIDGLGTVGCRQLLQNYQVELLDNRRAMIQSRASSQALSQGHEYDRIAIAAAVESAIASVYWAFWQYYGITWCNSIPDPSASDDELWQFLDFISPVSDCADASIADFDPYYFQAEYELGYPGTMDTWLDGHLNFGEDDYAGFYPIGVTIPAFRPEAMVDIDQWVQDEGSRLLFIYGEYDPWTGGMFDLGGATDSASLTVARGTHGARIERLDDADLGVALDKLEAWTGVAPDLGALAKPTRRAAPQAPRPPPAMLHALRLRGRR